MTGPHDPGDPGDPAPTGDPMVSQVIYALRDLRMEGPAMAEEVLTAANVSRWLTGAQIALVLAAFPRRRRVDWPVPPGDDIPALRPVGPAYVPPGERELVGPDHELHDEGQEDPPGVSWAAPSPSAGSARPATGSGCATQAATGVTCGNPQR